MEEESPDRTILINTDCIIHEEPSGGGGRVLSHSGAVLSTPDGVTTVGFRFCLLLRCEGISMGCLEEVTESSHGRGFLDFSLSPHASFS